MDVEFHNGKILHGDVLERLKEIPDESVDVEITSPPYWGLRDYGVKGQLGLEPDFRDYLKIMRQVMDELKRVLKKTGTCWINLGDSYAGTTMHSDWQGVDERFDSKRFREGEFKGTSKSQIQAKSRYGIPERFYIQCIDDGWLARNHIPWYKSNSMPSSIKDRFTNKWESVFFFAKEKKYYFNLDAVRERTLTDSKPFNIRVRENISGRAQMKLGDRAWTASEEEMKTYNKDGTRKMVEVPGQTTQGIHRNRTEGKPDWEENSDRKQDNVVMGNGRIDPTKKGFNKRYGEGKWQRHYDENGNCLGCGKHWTKHTISDTTKEGSGGAVSRSESIAWCNSKGKNPGDVFFINPRPFPESHFATFPPELPEKILKCACPEGGTVLDPFFGAGTVGLVAEQLNKKWIGIELSEEYIEMCKKRLAPYNSIRLDEFV